MWVPHGRLLYTGSHQRAEQAQHAVQTAQGNAAAGGVLLGYLMAEGKQLVKITAHLGHGPAAAEPARILKMQIQAAEVKIDRAHNGLCAVDVYKRQDLVILQLLTYATSYNMLPAVRDLDVPVVLVNVQKKKAPDYASTDIPTWLGELYACGAVGEMVADLERAGKRHAVITGVVEGCLLYTSRCV